MPMFLDQRADYLVSCAIPRIRPKPPTVFANTAR
jgi:hypothetical protein